jgi:ankyrin repeat protein
MDQEKRKNKFSKDFKDDGGYSPLHYACQLNQKECAKFLLMYHCSSLDVTAETGVRPRDLIQHDDIKRMFQIFYQKVDAAIKKES